MVGALALVAGLVGCSEPDPARELSAPSPTGQVAADCQAVMAALPASVVGLGTERSEPMLRTWGSPGISLRCGVERPATMSQTSRCDELGGVGWFAEDPNKAVDKAWRFTTIGRSGYVEVIVPEQYRPAGDALMDLAAAVTKMPVVRPCH